MFFSFKTGCFYQDWYLSWPIGNFSCKLVGGFFTYINFLATSWFLTIMSIDRYMSLKHRKPKKRTFEYSSKICGYVWLVATMGCSKTKMWPLSLYFMDERKTKKRPEKREASVKQFLLVFLFVHLFPNTPFWPYL